MTTTPAMPELPETTYSLFYEQPGDLDDEGYQYVLDEPGYTANQMRAYALATLQAQPAEVSDAEIYALWVEHCETTEKTTRQLVCDFARAILALRPQAVQMTDELRLLTAVRDEMAEHHDISVETERAVEALLASRGITAQGAQEGV